MAAQRYFPGLARCWRALRLSADRAGNAARKPARNAGVFDHEDKVTRETDSLLERAGFGKGAPGILGNWSPSSSTRTNDVSGFAMAASVLSRAARRTELHRSRGTEPPLDMLMTLQGVYEKSLGTLSPSPRRAPRWTRFGQWASSIYRSLTERLPRQHSAW